MDKDLLVNGKAYISAIRAAKKLGYATDYVGELARTGKIPARMVGRAWYIDFDALVEHKKNRRSRMQAARQEKLARTAPELATEAPIEIPLAAPLAYLPTLEKPTAHRPEPVFRTLLEKSAVALVALMMIGYSGVYILGDISPRTPAKFDAALAGASQASVLGSILDFFSGARTSTKPLVATSSTVSNSAAITSGGPANENSLNAILSGAPAKLPQMAEKAASAPSGTDALKSELEAYVRSQIALATPSARSSSAPIIYNETFTTQVLGQAVAHTSAQSSSDVELLSTGLGSLATNGRLTSPTLIGGTLKGVSIVDGDTTPGTIAITGLASLSGLTFQNATGTSATTTNLFATNGVFSSLTAGSLSVNNDTFTVGSQLNLVQSQNGTTQINARRATDTAPSGDFITYTNAAGDTPLFRVDNSGNIFAGGITNSGALTITSLSAPQFRVQYDSTNENTNSVDASGVTTFGFNGTTPKVRFTPQSNSADTFQFTDSSSAPVLSIDTSGKVVTLSNLVAGNGTTTNATSTTLFSSILTAGNATTTNFFTTTGSSTNLFASNAVIGTLTFSGGNGTTTSLSTGALTYTSAVGTSATTTNLYSTSGSIDSLGFISATGTSATTTNLFSTNGSFTNLTGTSLLSSSAIITNATTTNFFSTTASTTNLFTSALGIGTNSVNSSALVDLVSTTKGFLAPRMTDVQRDAIVSPATGLLIYNTTANEFDVYNGSTWTALGSGGGGSSQWTTSGANIYYTVGNIGVGTNQPTSARIVSFNANSTALPNSLGSTQASSTLRLGTANSALDFGTYGATGAEWIQASNPSNLGTSYPILLNPNSDSTGLVGIGTTAPSEKLDVEGTAATNIKVKSTGAFSAGLSIIPNNNAAGFTISANAAASPDLAIKNPSGTDVLHITNAGLVGIGTTTPISIFGLTVSGSGIATNNVTNDAGVYITGQSGAFGKIQAINNAATTAKNLAVNPDGGNVGIGTTAPGALLDVAATEATAYDPTDTQGQRSNGATIRAFNLSNTDNSFSQILFGNRGSGFDVARIVAETVSGGDNSKLHFITEGSGVPADRMTISNNGNVGIGTTNPLAPLHIKAPSASLAIIEGGVAGNSADVRFSAGGSSYWEVGKGFTAAGNNDLDIYDYQGTPGVRLSITSATGIVNIANGLSVATLAGTGNRCLKADSAGNIVAGSTDCATGGSGADNLGNHIATQNIQLNGNWLSNDGGNEGIRVTNTGLVGVNMASPIYTFQVQSPGSGSLTTSAAFRDSSTNANELIVRTGTGRADLLATWEGAGIDTALTFTPTTAAGAQVEAMRITAQGNVGIGTTTPAYLLQVEKDQNAATFVNAANTTNGTAARSGFYATNSSNTGVSLTTTSSNYTGVASWANRGLLVSDSSIGGLTLGAAGASADIRFETGGTGSAQERMRIDSSGNVGIGTTTPAATFSVECSSSGGICGSYVQNTAGTAASTVTRLGIGQTLTAASALILQFDHSTGNALILNRKTSTGTLDLQTTGGGIHIANSGFVGIGTSTPAFPLDVVGAIQSESATNPHFKLTNTGSGAAYLAQIPGSDPTKLWIGYNGASSLVLDSSGNVGIGTTTPAQKFDVAGSAQIETPSSGLALKLIGRSGDDLSNLLFYGNNASTLESGIQGINTGLNLFTSAAQPITFTASSTEAMRVTAAGLVGIGTTAPAGQLEVSQPSTGNVIVGRKDSSTLIGTDQGAWLQLRNFNTTDNDYAHIAFASNDTNGTAKNMAEIAGVFTSHAAASYSGDLAFLTSSSANPPSEKLRITGAGNVGIGTTNPDNKLQVNGTTHINGALIVGQSGVSDGQISVDGAAGNLQMLTNNNVREYISAAGNVGIGTTNPAVKLDVNGNLQVNNLIQGVTTLSLYGDKTASNGLIINSSGNVQINALAGTGNRCLKADSAGNIVAGSTDCATGGSGADNLGNHIATQNIQLNSFLLTNAGTNGLGIDNAGNVGIGAAAISAYRLKAVTSGTGALQLTTSNSTVGAPLADFYDSGRTVETVISSTDGTTAGTYIASYSAHPLMFSTQHASAQMTIAVSGNVGIGTTTPSVKLQIANGGNAFISLKPQVNHSQIFINRGDDTSVVGTVYESSASSQVWNTGMAESSVGTGNGYFIGTNADGSSAKLLIDTSGNVGIGTTTPGALLVLGGNGSVTGTQQWANFSDTVVGGTNFNSGLNQFQFGTISSSNLVFFASSTEAMRITPVGNIGIGTTNPGALLNVNGTEMLGTTGTTAGNLVIAAGSNSSSRSWRLLTNDAAQGDFSIQQSTTQLGSTYSTLLNIGPSGNIGIGTTNPTTGKLEVWGTTSGQSLLRLATTLDSGQGLDIKSVQTSTGHGYISFDNSVSSANWQNLVIPSGNVGIGTTNPGVLLQLESTAARLKLNTTGATTGLAAFESFDNGGADKWHVGLNAAGVTTDDSYLIDAAGVGVVATFQRSGNVGIGTTAPSAKLEVNGNIKISGVGNGLTFPDGTTITSNASAGTGITSATDLSFAADNDSNGSGVMSFATHGSTRLTIANTGGIGIGTASPSVPLHVSADGVNISGTLFGNVVAQNAAATAGIGLGYDATNILGVLNSTNSNSGLAFVTNNGSSNLERMRITSAGNVGIGTTTPDQLLDIAGRSGGRGYIKFEDHDPAIGNGLMGMDSSGLAIYSNTTGIPISFLTSNASADDTLAMRIASNGNIGIGTTAPIGKLDVFKSAASIADGLYLSNDSTTAGSGNSINFADSASQKRSAVIGGVWATNGTTDGYLSFSTRNGDSLSEKLRITNTGNVGIGTASPLARLDLGLQAPGTNTALTYQIQSAGNTNWVMSQGSIYDSTSVDQYQIFNGQLTGGTKAAPTFTGSPTGGYFIRNFTGAAFANSRLDLGYFSGSGAGQTGTTTLSVVGNNVGIGTTAPSAPLTVYGTDTSAGATNTVLRLVGANGVSNKSGGLLFKAVNSTTLAAERIAIIQSADQDSNVRNLSINPDGGSVGIGTTTPASTTKLDVVSGSASAITADVADGVYSFLTNDTTSGKQWGITPRGNNLAIREAGVSDVMTFQAGGNVGIGTTNPGNPLEVVGSGSGFTSVAYFKDLATNGNPLIQIGDAAHAISIGHVNTNPSAANYGFIAYTGLDPTLGQGIILKSNGNVGIGTTNPGTALDIRHVDTTANSSSVFWNGTYGGGLSLRNSTDTTNAVTGIGLYGGSGGNAVAALGMVQETANSLGGLAFYTGGSGRSSTVPERMRIDSAGNVGIGTTNPGATLDVIGNNNSYSTRVYTNASANVAMWVGGAANINNVSAGSGNAAATILHIARDTGSLRSINAEGTINASGADYAEYFYQDVPGTLQGGELVSLRPSGKAGAAQVGEPLIGVVSTNAGFVGNDLYDQNHPNNTALVGLTGQVNAKVSSEGGAIAIGDPISLSSVPGVGKKAGPSDAVIGIAETAWSGSGEGSVNVFLDKSANITYGLSLEDQEISGFKLDLAAATSSIADLQTLASTTAARVDALTLRVSALESASSTSSTIATGLTFDSTSTPSAVTSSFFSATSLGLRQGIENIAAASVEVTHNAIYAVAGTFDKLFAREVHTDEVCISDANGETCVTRGQLDSMLAQSGQSGTVSGITMPNDVMTNAQSSSNDAMTSGGTATSTATSTDDIAGQSASSTPAVDSGTDTASSTPSTDTATSSPTVADAGTATSTTP